MHRTDVYHTDMLSCTGPPLCCVLQCCNVLNCCCELQEGGEKFWELWGMYNIHDVSLSGIDFNAMLMQWPKLIGLFLVV